MSPEQFLKLFHKMYGAYHKETYWKLWRFPKYKLPAGSYWGNWEVFELPLPPGAAERIQAEEDDPNLKHMFDRFDVSMNQFLNQVSNDMTAELVTEGLIEKDDNETTVVDSEENAASSTIEAKSEVFEVVDISYDELSATDFDADAVDKKALTSTDVEKNAGIINCPGFYLPPNYIGAEKVPLFQYLELGCSAEEEAEEFEWDLHLPHTIFRETAATTEPVRRAEVPSTKIVSPTTQGALSVDILSSIKETKPIDSWEYSSFSKSTCGAKELAEQVEIMDLCSPSPLIKEVPKEVPLKREDSVNWFINSIPSVQGFESSHDFDSLNVCLDKLELVTGDDETFEEEIITIKAPPSLTPRLFIEEPKHTKSPFPPFPLHKEQQEIVSQSGVTKQEQPTPPKFTSYSSTVDTIRPNLKPFPIKKQSTPIKIAIPRIIFSQQPQIENPKEEDNEGFQIAFGGKRRKFKKFVVPEPVVQPLLRNPVSYKPTPREKLQPLLKPLISVAKEKCVKIQTGCQKLSFVKAQETQHQSTGKAKEPKCLNFENPEKQEDHGRRRLKVKRCPFKPMPSHKVYTEPMTQKLVETGTKGAKILVNNRNIECVWMEEKPENKEEENEVTLVGVVVQKAEENNKNIHSVETPVDVKVTLLCDSTTVEDNQKFCLGHADELTTVTVLATTEQSPREPVDVTEPGKHNAVWMKKKGKGGQESSGASRRKKEIRKERLEQIRKVATLAGLAQTSKEIKSTLALPVPEEMLQKQQQLSRLHKFTHVCKDHTGIDVDYGICKDCIKAAFRAEQEKYDFQLNMKSSEMLIGKEMKPLTHAQQLAIWLKSGTSYLGMSPIDVGENSIVNAESMTVPEMVEKNVKKQYESGKKRHNGKPTPGKSKKEALSKKNKQKMLSVTFAYDYPENEIPDVPMVMTASSEATVIKGSIESSEEKVDESKEAEFEEVESIITTTDGTSNSEFGTVELETKVTEMTPSTSGKVKDKSEALSRYLPKQLKPSKVEKQREVAGSEAKARKKKVVVMPSEPATSSKKEKTTKKR